MQVTVDDRCLHLQTEEYLRLATEDFVCIASSQNQPLRGELIVIRINQDKGKDGDRNRRME